MTVLGLLLIHFVDGTNLEERVGRATAVGSVFDLSLLGQVIGRVDRSLHLGGSQESGQVGGVGGDHDKREEPPHAGNHSGGNCS